MEHAWVRRKKEDAKQEKVDISNLQATVKLYNTLVRELWLLVQVDDSFFLLSLFFFSWNSE
jgi:hypothetical protein